MNVRLLDSRDQGRLGDLYHSQKRVPPPGTEAFYQTSFFELLIDIDDEHSWKTFVRVLPAVESFYGVHHIRIWPSRRKGAHVHMTLMVPTISYKETYLLQAVLGSDPMRELMNTVDQHLYTLGLEENLLFKPIREEEE